MKLTNLLNDIGFINKSDLMHRMAQSTPPDNDHYYLKKLNNNFSEIGITYYGATRKICVVFTRKNVYSFIRRLFTDIAKDVNLPAVSD